jgi:hypothetical protein
MVRGLSGNVCLLSFPDSPLVYDTEFLCSQPFTQYFNLTFMPLLQILFIIGNAYSKNTTGP